MKASFCARETKEEYTSVWSSHKANCMFPVRLLGKATQWLVAGRKPSSGEQGAGTLCSESYEAAWEAFLILQESKRRTGAYIFYFLNGRNHNLERPKFSQKNSLREKRTPHWKNKQKKHMESVPQSFPYNKLQTLRTSFLIPGQEFLYFYYHWLDNESSVQFSGQWKLKAKSFRNH